MSGTRPTVKVSGLPHTSPKRRCPCFPHYRSIGDDRRTEIRYVHTAVPSHPETDLNVVKRFPWGSTCNIPTTNFHIETPIFFIVVMCAVCQE